MLVTKILDGTWLQAFRFNFSLVINQKTAKELGLTIPQSLLHRLRRRSESVRAARARPSPHSNVGPKSGD
jgi:ABC-type uncharacterized transport system substrate-binding protein